MTNFDDLKFAVQAISGGRNTVLLDDMGMPSVMVPFPKLTYADIMTGGTQDPLPAFLVDGHEIPVIYESKYQNIVVNDRAYSLPFEDPRVYATFDQALQFCRNKGDGWHLHSNALWAAIQSWCYKNQTVPHGNGNYGKDYSNPHEHGVVTYRYASGANMIDGRTATGSGPVTWYHNYDSSGIADLCGNIWEWVAGLRMVNGEIQIIPYGNCMKADCNMSATSTEWKAIMPNGTLVAPGTAGTLKYDGESASGAPRINTAVEFAPTGDGYYHRQFGTLPAKTGVDIPPIMKALGLAPIADYEYGNGEFFIRPQEAERLPIRGAHWFSTTSAGVAALSLNHPRSISNYSVGFRAAFYEKLQTA